MALVNSAFTVNVTPGAMPPIVHVSEYDVGRTYTVTINGENGSAFNIPTGTTATIEGTLNGSVGFTQSATISNNQVSFALSESMTAYAGKAWCKIKLTLNNQPIQTCAFVLAVDRAGVEAETVIGASGFEEQIQEAVEEWAEQQGFTSPTVTTTPITGGNRVTFTDAQHPQGQSIDVMDGNTINVDSTLSIEGAAADAKAVGDRLEALEAGNIKGVFEYDYTPTPGYRNAQGVIQSQTSNNEYYTDLLMVSPGEEVTCTVKTASTRNLWVRCSQFDEGQTHVKSTDSSKSSTVFEYTVEVAEGVRYLSFSYRSFDDMVSVEITKPMPKTDITLSHEGMAADAKVVGEKFRKISYPVTGFTMADASDIYHVNGALSNTRCSNAVFPLKAKKGDKIVLADKSAYRIYVRCFVNGLMQYKAAAWTTDDFVVPYDSEVVITFSKNPEANFYDAWSVATEQISVEIETNENDLLIEKALIEKPENLLVARKLVTGYIASSGGGVEMRNATTGAQEKASEFIPASFGDVFSLVQKFPGDFSGTTYATCQFYDSNKQPLGNRIGGNMTATAGADGKQTLVASFSATNENTAYIRVSFRTWGEILLAALYKNAFPTTPSLSQEDLNAVMNVPNMPSPISIKYPFKSINHRGYRGNGAPENTLPAFRASKAYGFDFAETDVYETSDGALVCWHDANITINGTSKAVGNCTLAEIKSVSLGTGDYAGTKIPQFHEFIALCKAIELNPYIELKVLSEAAIGRMVEICKKYGIIDRCTWISFDVMRLSFVSNAYRMARLGMLGSVSEAQALKNGVNEVFCNINVYTQAKADECFAAGVGYEVYTVDVVDTIKGLPPYCTGVSSDNTIAGKVLYDAAMEE